MVCGVKVYGAMCNWWSHDGWDWQVGLEWDGLHVGEGDQQYACDRVGSQQLAAGHRPRAGPATSGRSKLRNWQAFDNACGSLAAAHGVVRSAAIHPVVKKKNMM